MICWSQKLCISYVQFTLSAHLYQILYETYPKLLGKSYYVTCIYPISWEDLFQYTHLLSSSKLVHAKVTESRLTSTCCNLSVREWWTGDKFLILHVIFTHHIKGACDLYLVYEWPSWGFPEQISPKTISITLTKLGRMLLYRMHFTSHASDAACDLVFPMWLARQRLLMQVHLQEI